jgi:hypothetical protein
MSARSGNRKIKIITRRVMIKPVPNKNKKVILKEI